MPNYGVTVSTHHHFMITIEADTLDEAFDLARSFNGEELQENASDIAHTKNITSYAELDIKPVEWLYCDL